ncbi:hypothetical protein [Phocaeicola sartorii]|nr:hypothetical protein [Phocaeicola sartorii]MCR1847095.1 hypothetical protein [Phocaeicola sartorii]
MSAFAEVFRKEISDSATDIICIDGKAMRGTLYKYIWNTAGLS